MYVGWQHYSRNSFRVVTSAKGGGTRTITCKASEDITVEDIIKQAKKFFFKDGNSYFGKLETMSACLVNPSGETIVEFTDTNGDLCSYSDYLKAYGMYPSQCHLYLRTQTESLNESSLNSTESTDIYHVNDSAADSDTVEVSQIKTFKKKLFLVNGQQVGTLDIVYGKVKPSLYSSTASALYCKSYETCISLASNNEIYDSYDVFEDGFTVRGVSKNNKQYLVENESNYIFTETINSSKNDLVIVHGPDEIHGTEADDSEHLLLGALTLYHNQSFMYRWYRGDDLVDSGLDHCLLRIQEPGVYTAEIVCSDSLIVRSLGVSVSVSDQQDRITEHSQLLIFPSDAQHESLEVESQLVSVLTQQQLENNVSQSHHVSVPSQSPQYHESSGVEQSHLVSIRQSQLLSVPSQLPQEIAVEQSHIVGVPSQLPQESIIEQPRRISVLSQSPQEKTVQQTHIVSVPSQTQQLRAVEQSHLVSIRQSQLLGVPSQLPQESAEQQPNLFGVPSQSLQESTVEQSHLVSVPSPLPQKKSVVKSCLVSVRSQTPQQSTVEQPRLLSVPSQSPQKSTVSQSQLFCVPSQLQQERTVSQSQLVSVPSQPPQETQPFVSDLSFSSVSVPKINILDIKIGEEIGRGAFGIVYKADWLGTSVAVKEIVVRRMKISKPVIERELELHSRVRHPNIVLLMAYATKLDRLYLVSELIVGDTLDDMLFGDERESLSRLTKLDISKKVSQSVAYLHCQRPVIIHRDIKPDNIMVSNDFRVVKLCDMGLSKLKTMNTIMTTLAGGSAQPGTPAYQAPEVLLQQNSGNPKTDVWALCCTLVEVFCETPIWDYPIHQDADPVQYTIERMRLEAQPDGLQGLASKVNAAIYSVLDKGLSYRPVERPDALKIVKVFEQ